MPSNCPLLRQEYEAIKSLKQEFDLEYAQAAGKSNDPEETKKAIIRAKEFKKELEEKMDALSAKLWPFESHLSFEALKQQYDFQKAILEQIGILKQLPDGQMGIKAIDNKEYPFPTLKEVMTQMREKKELLKTKTEQGFIKLLITPFGMKLDDLIAKYKQVILSHYADMPDPNDPAKRIPDSQKTKLFAAKKNPNDPNEQLQPLELDTTNPVWGWKEYQNADISGELVYYPKKFTQDTKKKKGEHQGKTKGEVLTQTHSGFNIILIEDLPNIPRRGNGQEKAGRKQQETEQSPNQYLEIFKTAATDPKSKYLGESGMTPEDQIIYAIYHLEETNQVIDDWQGEGSISYQLAAWFKNSGGVPYAFWNRVNRRANLGRRGPVLSVSSLGARGAVRVSMS